MDAETITNCSVFCFESHSSDEECDFVIHELRNDFNKLCAFLKRNRDKEEWHVSYNGLGFDAQIVEYILRNEKNLFTLPGHRIAQLIYDKAQEVIARSQAREWQQYPEWELQIKNVDVFALNHWNNAAKSSALKWIQYTMDWYNIQEMPIHHTAVITTKEEIDDIVYYCKNDVKSTKNIMKLSKEQINLRAKLTKEYGINLYSASEPSIAKKLFLYFLEKKTGISQYELKKTSTLRTEIRVDKIILPYVNFKRQEFTMLLNNLRKLIIDPKNIKGSFKYSIKYRGVKIDLGLGGIHGFSKPGMHVAPEGFVIKTVDVTSFYPNLAIRNGWYPAHLPKKAFVEQYEWFFDERKKIPKKDPKNYVFKIILNSSYGLSIEPNSFLYDPQFGMQITINGQLLICLLSEMLAENIPDASLLMINTDGLEIMIPKSYEEKYNQICKEWETTTKLQLEHDEYEKLYLWDVNNYIGLFKNGKTKAKGRFEFEPFEKYEIQVLHKNKSFLVVPKAIFNYLIHGKDPAETLKEEKNIFNFCGGVRAKSNWQLTEYITNQGNGIQTEDIQKTLRYYISNKGNKIMKVNKADGRMIQIEAGLSMCTKYNVHRPDKKWEDYDINYAFYLKKIYRELDIIYPKPKAQVELNFPA